MNKMAKHDQTSHHNRMEELERQFQADIDSIVPLLKFYSSIKQALESEQCSPNNVLNTSTNNKENL